MLDNCHISPMKKPANAGGYCELKIIKRKVLQHMSAESKQADLSLYPAQD
jgi:hypothetical protein